MRSLVVLMMEDEQPEGLSARKLVVETAKHNVLTAYDAEDGLDLLKRFPRVDAILVHHALLKRYPGLLEEVRAMAPEIPIVFVHPLRYCPSPIICRVVDSHVPQELLSILADLESGRLGAEGGTH